MQIITKCNVDKSKRMETTIYIRRLRGIKIDFWAINFKLKEYIL